MAASITTIRYQGHPILYDFSLCNALLQKPAVAVDVLFIPVISPHRIGRTHRLLYICHTARWIFPALLWYVTSSSYGFWRIVEFMMPSSFMRRCRLPSSTMVYSDRHRIKNSCSRTSSKSEPHASSRRSLSCKKLLKLIFQNFILLMVKRLSQIVQVGIGL